MRGDQRDPMRHGSPQDFKCLLVLQFMNFFIENSSVMLHAPLQLCCGPFWMCQFEHTSDTDLEASTMHQFNPDQSSLILLKLYLTWNPVMNEISGQCLKILPKSRSINIQGQSIMTYVCYCLMLMGHATTNLNAAVSNQTCTKYFFAKSKQELHKMWVFTV